MSFDRTRRTASDPRRAAEAAFRAVTKPQQAAEAPAEKPAPAAPVPGVRETVSLRLDKTVLEHFQKDGPGWQDRINAALKAAAGL